MCLLKYGLLHIVEHFGGVDLVLEGIPRIRGNTKRRNHTKEYYAPNIQKHRKNSTLEKVIKKIKVSSIKKSLNH